MPGFEHGLNRAIGSFFIRNSYRVYTKGILCYRFPW